MTDGTIATHARAAETAIENLSRAGWSAGSVPISEGIYSTITDLAAMSRHLRDAIDHISRALDERAEIGALQLDANGEARYPTPGAAIASSKLALDEAIQASRALATALDEAQQITATIADTGNLPPDEGPCRICGHEHGDHDGGHGPCLVATDPGDGPDQSDWVDCDCTRYEPRGDGPWT